MRGYCEIGIYHGKTIANLGTLWRTAYQLGASGIFVIGQRFRRQPSDTLATYRHIPLREYRDIAQFLDNRPYDCQLIGVEMGGQPLRSFVHPPRAIYLLGAEDGGLPSVVQAACQAIISLEAVRTLSYNVAIAGALVLYHRQGFFKEVPHVPTL